MGKSAFEVAIPSLALIVPPVGRTVESNSCWKPCEAVSASEAVVGLSGEAPGEVSPASVDPCWPRGGGIARQNLLVKVNNWRRSISLIGLRS